MTPFGNFGNFPGMMGGYPMMSGYPMMGGYPIMGGYPMTGGYPIAKLGLVNCAINYGN